MPSGNEKQDMEAMATQARRMIRATLPEATKPRSGSPVFLIGDPGKHFRAARKAPARRECYSSPVRLRVSPSLPSPAGG